MAYSLNRLCVLANNYLIVQTSTQLVSIPVFVNELLELHCHILLLLLAFYNTHTRAQLNILENKVLDSKMRLLCSLYVVLYLVINTSYAHNSGHWTQLKPTGFPPAGRVYHSAAAIGSTIYICGGSKNHNHTHYYDININKWFEESDASLPHNALAADMDEVGGVLYLFGGKDTTTGKAVGNGHVNDLFTFKTGRDNMKWQKITTAASPIVRDGHATSALKGFVFMFGGWDETQYFNDLHVFDTTKLVATGGTGNNFDLIKWTELKTIPGTPFYGNYWF